MARKIFQTPPGDPNIGFLVPKTSEMVNIDQKTKSQPKISTLAKEKNFTADVYSKGGQNQPPPA